MGAGPDSGQHKDFVAGLLRRLIEVGEESQELPQSPFRRATRRANKEARKNLRLVVSNDDERKAER